VELAILLYTVPLLLTAGSLLAVVVYRRRWVAERREASRLVAERSEVKWQAGRWDAGNAGRLYVPNVGEDTAHEVSVVARDMHDTVALKVDQVPPYQPGDDRSPEPCCVEFSLK
jgi:hypothetical protein